MSFMQPQIVLGYWQEYSINGECFVGFNGDDIPDGAEAVAIRQGHGARLSAPGYMDCTEWTVFDTEADAAQYLLDTYYDMADDELSDDERSERAELEALL